MNIKGLTKTIGGTISKNSPAILTGLSVTGLVATTVMGISATPKALRIIEELEKESTYEGVPLTRKDIAKATWKCYVPTAVMGVISIVCIIGANSINTRRNAALAGLYSLSETAMKEYQAKVVERIGEGPEREIKDEIARDRITRDPVSNHEVIIGRGETLCYDSMSGRYFWGDMETIKSAVNKINVRMRNDMFVPLNDLYSELDLEGTKTGDLLGWYIDDGAFDPEFSTQLSEDGRPCLVLDFSAEPRYLKRDY